MENRKFCQSCSMPLDDATLLGTEANGTPSHDYCKYCYQHGAFTHPGLTLDEMKEYMIKVMEKEDLPEDVLEAAITRLSHLKRWSAKQQ